MPKALIIKEPNGTFSLEEVEKYSPKTGEILIENHAVAQNPVDYKMHELNFWIPSYPWVLGVDVAGVVEEVGEGVTSFKKGDRVFTFVKVPGTDKSTGAFQQYTIGNANLSSKIPENLSFEEAATIPLAAVTAIVGIYSDLKISPPWTGASYHGEPFLVWGGASSVGMLAVQFAKLSGFKVITTASSRNYELVKSLGVDIVIDYNDSQVVEKIRQASNGKLKYVFDAVVSNGSTELAAEALGVDHGEIVTVLRVDQAKFSNATIYPTFAGLIHNNDNPTVHELGKQFWAHLEDYLKNGKVKPNPQKILSGGLLAIPEGFKLHKAGKISGEKLVYQVKQTPGL